MNVVIKVNDEVKEKMIEYYKDKRRDKVIPYVVFQAQEEDTVITLYESGKAMFQGVSADVDAAMWGTILDNTKEKKAEKKLAEAKYYNCNAVGSDEVGTGDYFGPIVVTACYVKKEDIAFLEKLGVGDSKKIDDTKIKKIAPEIAKKIKYRSVILSNKEYNEKYTKDINMNKIKAIMHNKVLYQLMQEEKPSIDYIIVDEFARETRYYEYLNGVTAIQKNITFMTKAEDKNLAVACGSIISRYLFLKEFDKLCDSIHIPLPKGAGKDVDKIGEEVVAKYGKEKLKEIAKFNFKNTDRILHTLIF
ncbi:MAG: ribonuclease HIII [Mycoplasmatota bacterium]|nr:ribonuclease HIII [Mycoplasmatota bacterium]